jgi:hypothetical protein
MAENEDKYLWVNTLSGKKRPARILGVIKETYGLHKIDYVTVRYLDASEEELYECVALKQTAPMTPEEEAIYKQLI